MKCLRCHLVNFRTAVNCQRCQAPLSPTRRESKIFQDGDFLVIENLAALPSRCYQCNSRKIAAVQRQTLEYTPPLEELLDIVVGQIVPLPLPSLAPNKKVVHLDLYFCPVHRTWRRALFKIGAGILLFGALCFAVGIVFNENSFVFGVSAITSVFAFCIGALTLYVEKQRDIVSRHKYQAPYFWVKGFGREYVGSFPEWTNSAAARAGRQNQTV